MDRGSRTQNSLGRLTEMEVPSWLAVSGAVVGLCGGAAGIVSAVVHSVSFRTKKLNAIRSELSRAWTNEGSINSADTVLITLELKMEHGDVFGSLQTTAHEWLLEAHLEPHLTSATLRVSEFRSRSSRTVAVVRLQLTGNRNRIKWRVISGNSEHWIPDETLLWPSDVGVDSWRR